MSYLQISSVVTENLSSKEIAFLENAEMDLFVDVVEGDESRAGAIQMEVLTLEQVLEEIVYGQRIIFGEKPASMPQEFDKVKSYWKGEFTFEKMED